LETEEIVKEFSADEANVGANYIANSGVNFQKSFLRDVATETVRGMKKNPKFKEVIEQVLKKHNLTPYGKSAIKKAVSLMLNRRGISTKRAKKRQVTRSFKIPTFTNKNGQRAWRF
jgi:hypothetical protein